MNISKMLHRDVVAFGEAAGAADWHGSIKAGEQSLEIDEIEVILLQGGRYMVRALLKLDHETKGPPQ